GRDDEAAPSRRTKHLAPHLRVGRLVRAPERVASEVGQEDHRQQRADEQRRCWPRDPSSRSGDHPGARLLDPLYAALAPPRAAFATLAADAVQLELVAAYDEAEKPRDPLLQLLQLVAGELHDLSTALADDVIVVLHFLFGRHLVPRLPVVEVALGGDAALPQQAQRAIDGGVADPRVGAPHGVMDLLDRSVS